MALKFNQNEQGAWVAEFEVTQDFNLHIEREEGGDTSMLISAPPQRVYTMASRVHRLTLPTLL